MAEGWTRSLKGNLFDVYSAGIETHGLDENAVKVMKEAGVDISGHKSQNVKDFLDKGIDFVITVCSHAHESCPVFPGKAKIIHKGFEDPPAMAMTKETEEEKLDCYRRVRDQIKRFVETLPDAFYS